MTKCVFKKHGINISPTYLALWLACRKKSKLYTEGWQRERPKSYFIFGELIHALVEERGKRNGRGLGPKKIRRVIEDYQKDRTHLWTNKEAQEFEFIAAQVMAVFRAYQKKYREEDRGIEWLDCETWFNPYYEFEPGASARLAGKIDNVVRFPGDSGLWVMDTKTTSRLDPRSINDLITSNLQLYYYAFIVWKTRGYSRPAGVVFNMVRRPQLRWTQKEDLLQHQERVFEHIRKKPKDYFQRIPHVLTARAMRHFEKELKELLSDIKAWVYLGQRTRFFGMPCVDKYGPCEFMPICYEGNTVGFTNRKKERKSG